METSKERSIPVRIIGDKTNTVNDNKISLDNSNLGHGFSVNRLGDMGNKNFSESKFSKFINNNTNMNNNEMETSISSSKLNMPSFNNIAQKFNSMKSEGVKSGNIASESVSQIGGIVSKLMNIVKSAGLFIVKKPLLAGGIALSIILLLNINLIHKTVLLSSIENSKADIISISNELKNKNTNYNTSISNLESKLANLKKEQIEFNKVKNTTLKNKTEKMNTYVKELKSLTGIQ